MGDDQLGLTPLMRRCLDVIERYVRTTGSAPSYSEIADALGMTSKSGVYRIVTALVDRGYLTRGRRGEARSINLRHPPDALRRQKQRYRHDPNGVQGDCYRTAVACLLGMPVIHVPHVYSDPRTGWQEGVDRMNAFLAPLNIVQIDLALVGDLHQVLAMIARFNPGLPFLLTGRSRNGTNHVVVCQDGAIVHDPALDDSGIAGPTDQDCYFVTFLGRRLAPLKTEPAEPGLPSMEPAT